MKKKKAKCSFDTRFRETVDRVMTALNMQLVSTPLQIENGTLLYKDPVTGALYGFYESGYCRRFIQSDLHWGVAQTVNGIGYKIYQLNRVVDEVYTHRGFDGKLYTGSKKARVPAGPMEQLGIVTASIVGYRMRAIQRKLAD